MQSLTHWPFQTGVFPLDKEVDMTETHLLQVGYKCKLSQSTNKKHNATDINSHHILHNAECRLTTAEL